jgi:hypothetical protein
MARKEMNDYTGRLGNLIFYRWKNKKCIRTIPSRVRQTEETKRMADLFGKASAIGRLLRTSLADVLLDHKETKMRLKFSNAILQWLRSHQPGDAATHLPFINRFSFTERSLPNILVKNLEVEWLNDKVMIRIPAFSFPGDLPAPRNTKAVELKPVLVGCTIDSRKSILLQFDKLEFDDEISAEEKVIEFDLPHMNETLFLVVLSMQYKAPDENGLKYLEDKRWRMVGVVGSCYHPVDVGE